MLNSSKDHYGLHQGKKCQSDHGVWSPQQKYLKAYIIHQHGPTDLAVGGFLVEKKKAKAHGRDILLK